MKIMVVNPKRSFLLLIVLFVFVAVACRERVTNSSPTVSVQATSAAVTAAPPSKLEASGVTPSKLSPDPIHPSPTVEAIPLTQDPGPTHPPPTAESASPTQDPGSVSHAQPLEELPAGLLLAQGSMDEGWDLLMAGEDGQLRMLVEQIAPAHYRPDFDVSPDGRQLLYAAAGEIWLFAIDSSATTNVTNTPERQEQAPRWLPGGNGFVCGSMPESPEMEGRPIGYLTLVSFDGEYEVLVDEGVLAAPPAPAPDGQNIAYSRSHQRQVLPFIYQIGTGESQVDFGSPDLDWVEKTWEATWSPAGHQLAWSSAGEQEGEWRAAEILLDLADETNSLLHNYRPLGMGGYIPAPSWSPDGSWLVFVAEDEQPEGQGIWRIDLQSGSKDQLYPWCVRGSMVHHPSISLDSKWIAAPLCASGGVALIDADTFTAAEWEAPTWVAAVAWAEPPSLAATAAGDEDALPYQNETFGFQLTLPPAWEGYQTTERIYAVGQLPDAGSVCFTFEGHMPICILKIDIWTKAGWAKQDWIPDGYYLSENEDFVFAEGPYQAECVQLDDFQCERHQELPAILASLRIEP